MTEDEKRQIAREIVAKILREALYYDAVVKAFAEFRKEKVND